MVQSCVPNQLLISMLAWSHVIAKSFSMPVLKFNITGHYVLYAKGFNLKNDDWQHGILSSFFVPDETTCVSDQPLLLTLEVSCEFQAYCGCFLWLNGVIGVRILVSFGICANFSATVIIKI